MYGDISNIDVCRKAVKNIDIISNQAALGSVPRSVNDPLSSHSANVNGFLNILIAAKEEGIKRIVYASSSSVYGDHPKLPKIEENTGNVLSPYAATKAIDEIYAGVFTRCYDIECIGFRYFNVFGPRQDPNGAYAAVIPKFIKLMKEEKSPVINGDGSFSRDFTYVENIVHANILGMSIDNKECYGEAFNIGAGGQYNLLQLVQILNKELKTDIEPIFGPNRKGDIPHSNADINKAKNMLGYNPTINFEEGVVKTVNFYCKTYSILSSLNPCNINIKENNILHYLLTNTDEVAISIDSKNIDLAQNFIIPGNKTLIKLEYKINENIQEFENKFGIIADKEIINKHKFGNLGIVPKAPELIQEPLRISYDLAIYDELECHFKKLFLLNTKYEADYKNKNLEEILSLEINYKSIFNNYKSRAEIELSRTDGLLAKYYDCLLIYQENKLENEQMCKMYDWFKMYLTIYDKLAHNIVKKLNKLFPDSKGYYIQNNPPIRISSPTSLGTPLHQDTYSQKIKVENINDYKKSTYDPKFNMQEESIYIEQPQNKYIFNFNYTLYESHPEQSMRICTDSISNMNVDKTFFFRIKQNKKNEAILFSPYNTLHYRSNQYKGFSIRGDIRIISYENYHQSDLNQFTGPRLNLNVGFGRKKDCPEKKYSVFMDKLYN